jgi:hypothetical protein
MMRLNDSRTVAIRIDKSKDEWWDMRRTWPILGVQLKHKVRWLRGGNGLPKAMSAVEEYRSHSRAITRD